MKHVIVSVFQSRVRLTINTNHQQKYWLVIPASGTSERFGGEIPKQYLKLDNGLTVLDTVLSKLLVLPIISGCIVVLNAHDTQFSNSRYIDHPKLSTTVGGKERFHSIYCALEYLEQYAHPNDWVLVHDAVRPCILCKDVQQLIDQTQNDIGGILATPISSTLKLSNQGTIKKTIDRGHIWQAQTPQLLRFKLLSEALSLAIKKQTFITDDAHALELLGYYPKIVLGREDNIKITYAKDIVLANLILKQQNAD